MTKAEKAQLTNVTRERNTANEERDIARALSWPNFPKPKPMEKPNRSDEYIHGWTINTYTGKINENYQNFLYSYPAKDDGTRSGWGSQVRDPLYPTKKEAYLALYHELCWKYGRILADILKLANNEE